MIEAPSAPDTALIAKALNTIHNPRSQAHNVKMANDYLHQCQLQAGFPQLLLEIYRQAPQSLMRVSAILLLTNVIKRSWGRRKSEHTRNLTPQEKDRLRGAVLEAYNLHDMKHHKHFNQLIRHLAKLDYPHQFPGLQEFLMSGLNQLRDNLRRDEKALQPDWVLAMLSTVKIVMKEFSNRRLAHKDEHFANNVAPIIKVCHDMSFQVHSLCLRPGKFQDLELPVQCLKKVEKIILYGVACMPKDFPHETLLDILKRRIENLGQIEAGLFMNHIHAVSSYWRVTQKYAIGILEQVSRIQGLYPAMFAPIVSDYCRHLLLYLQRLSECLFEFDEKLINIIITANSKPITTPLYFHAQQQYLESAWLRRHPKDTPQLQAQCHNQFVQCYNSQSIPSIIDFLIHKIMTRSDVIDTYKEITKDSLVEDADMAIVDYLSEPTTYQRCLRLLKDLMNCSSDTAEIARQVLAQVPRLVQTGDANNKDVVVNILEFGLQLPYALSSQQLPMNEITHIISFLFQSKQHTFLARYLRKFHYYLPSDSVHQAFMVLANILASPPDPSMTPAAVCQAALTLRHLISQLEHERFPVQLLEPCLMNMTSLVLGGEFRINPPLLWALTTLMMRLVRCIWDEDKPLCQQASAVIIKGLAPLFNEDQHQELIVSAIGELLTTLLHCCFHTVKANYINPSQPIQICHGEVHLVIEGCFQLVRKNIDNEMLEGHEVVHKMWLALLQYYPTLTQQQQAGLSLLSLNEKLVKLFQEKWQRMLPDNSHILCQLTEEYLLTQLLPLSQEQFCSIVERTTSAVEPQKRTRLIFAVANFYHSYALLQQPNQNLLLFLMRELKEMRNKVTPAINALRTYTFLVMGWQFLNTPAGDIIDFFNGAMGGHGQWLPTYLHNTQFMSNKFAYKLNSAVVMKMIGDVGARRMAEMLVSPTAEGDLPIDWLLRTVNMCLDPIEPSSVLDKYNNLLRENLTDALHPEFALRRYRKLSLHLGQPQLVQLMEQDLKPSLGTYLGGLLKQLDWTSQDLEQRVGEPAALDLCSSLGWPRRIQ